MKATLRPLRMAIFSPEFVRANAEAAAAALNASFYQLVDLEKELVQERLAARQAKESQ